MNTSFYAQVAASVLFILLITTAAATAMKETRRGDKNSPTLCDDKQGELGCIKQQECSPCTEGSHEVGEWDALVCWKVFISIDLLITLSSSGSPCYFPLTQRPSIMWIFPLAVLWQYGCCSFCSPSMLPWAFVLQEMSTAHQQELMTEGSALWSTTTLSPCQQLRGIDIFWSRAPNSPKDKHLRASTVHSAASTRGTFHSSAGTWWKQLSGVVKDHYNMRQYN